VRIHCAQSRGCAQISERPMSDTLSTTYNQDRRVAKICWCLRWSTAITRVDCCGML
jgi:hypothetical protein